MVAAPIVAVVADGIVLVFASRSVATSIVATARLASAVALFAFFDNSVAALLASNGADILVVRQAGCLDTVTADSAAYVSNAARTEILDSRAGRRVHDILFACITSTGTQRTALRASGRA